MSISTETWNRYPNFLWTLWPEYCLSCLFWYPLKFVRSLYHCSSIDIIHKSQNALVPYCRILWSEQNISVLSGAFWDLEEVHTGICEICLLKIGYSQVKSMGMRFPHYCDVIMSTMASQITGDPNVCSTVCIDVHQWNHQSSASLALCEENPPVTGRFPSQRASNAGNSSISWRHHEMSCSD